MMHYRTHSLLKLVVWALYFQGSLAEDLFKKDGSNMKFDGSSQTGKTILLVKAESLTVELKGEKVQVDIGKPRMQLSFGGCTVSPRLDMDTVGARLLFDDGKTLDFPVSATITKDGTTFVDKDGKEYKPNCKPVFKKGKGGYAIGVGTDLGKSVNQLSIIYKDASIYDASSESSFGPVEISLAAVGGSILFLLILIGSGFGLFKFIKRRRLAQIAQPVAQPPVKPAPKSESKQAEKPEVKPKTKTVDEVEDEKPEAPPKEKTEEAPEKAHKKSKPAKRSTPEEPTDLQTKSEEVLTMKRPADFRLKTAEFRPSIPFNAKLAEKTAIDDPETEAKWKAARLASKETDDADGPYEVPEFVSNHYLKRSKMLRKLLSFNAAHRRFVIYFRDLCVRVFKRCEKMLDAIERGWVRDVQTYEFRKEIIKICEICREIYQSVQAGRNTSKFPWVFDSIEELGQLGVHEIKWAFDVEPPTAKQAIAIKEGLKKLSDLRDKQEASKDPALEKTEKILRTITELDKLASRHYQK